MTSQSDRATETSQRNRIPTPAKDIEVDNPQLRSIIQEEVGKAVQLEVGKAHQAFIPEILARISLEIQKAMTENNRQGGQQERQPERQPEVVRGEERERERIPEPEQRGFSYKDFSTCKPPMFEGKPNPIVSM